MSDFKTPDGRTLNVADDEEIGKADYLVAPLYDGDPKHLIFSDNMTAPCDKCGRMVQYRPHADMIEKKMCLECATKLQNEQEAAGDTIQTYVSKRTAVQASAEYITNNLYGMIRAESMDEFERFAKFFPGIEKVRKHLWKCKCGKENCLITCVRGHAMAFPGPASYIQWLDGVVDFDSEEDIDAYTDAFARKHNIENIETDEFGDEHPVKPPTFN